MSTRTEIEGCPILRQIYAHHCIVLYPHNNNTIQLRTTQYNRIQYNAMHKFVGVLDKYVPPGRVKLKTLASQNFGKRNRWIINLLLDVLVCSIAVYFYELCSILTSP